MRRDRDDHRDRGSNDDLSNNSNKDRGGRRDGLEDYSPERKRHEVVDTLSPPPRPGRGDQDGSDNS